MDIYVLDSSAQILDMIDTFESNIWTVQYFDTNDFELVVPATDKNIDLLQKDRLLCRDKDRDGGTWQNVMIIENIKIVADWEDGNQMTVSGRGLKSIVGRRVIWKQTNLTGKVETGIRQIITENIISPDDEKRKIDNFILDEPAGITDTFDIQAMGEDLDEWITSACQTYGIGWDVYIKDGKFVFKLYKGLDRSYNQKNRLPVVFSDEFDNLLASTYTYERAEFKNAALIGGEGEGVNQRTTTIGDSSGLERYEAYIDGSSVSSNGTIITEEQYYKMLQDYAKDELNTTSFTESFEGNVIPDGNYILNQDYFLGDTVQVINEYGISATPRIVEIIESEDQNGTSIVPTFSTWEV
jgi:hypothetical protein